MEKLYFFLILCISVLHIQAQELPQVINKIAPSTVTIIAYHKNGESIRQGRGFFISQDGDIITNRHVLINAQRAEIKTSDGKVYPITRVIADNKDADIIRVKVNIPKSYPYLSLSHSTPEIGERIVVVSNRLRGKKNASDGIVSAVSEISELGKIYEITASISPGSSGSPVVNMKCEVIGVATFQSRDDQDVNFVISSEYISKLRAGEGITFEEWTEQNVEVTLTCTGILNAARFITLWDGKYEEAIHYYEKLVKENPNNVEAYNNLGFAYSELGSWTEAIECFKRVIRLNPDCLEPYCQLGIAYGNIGEWEKAIKSFERAIRLKPDYADAYSHLGNTYYRLERWTEAIESFKQAIRLNPYDAETHYNLGVVYDEIGKWAEAIKNYKQAIRIDPDLVNAHLNMGFNYYKLGRWREAIDCFRRVIRLKPDYAEAHFGLGVVFENIRRYTKAIEFYKQAIRLKPDFAGAHYCIGINYLILGDRGAALERYKILKDIDEDLANELLEQIKKSHDRRRNK